MKLPMVILAFFIISCGGDQGKVIHIDELPKLVSESKKALVYLDTHIKREASFYRDSDLLAHYYGGKLLPALHPGKTGRSGCSAFFIDLAEGYIVTNEHCIDGAKRIDLELANGKSYLGEVVGADKYTDVALLKVSDRQFDRNGLGELEFTSKKPVQGDAVVALGAPLTYKGASTTGNIASFNHLLNDQRQLLYPYNSAGGHLAMFGEYIHHDALIQGGNSGGPLLNSDGQVIGINSRAAVDRREVRRGDSVVVSSSSYAVSYTTVEHVIARLREDRSCKWGDIGVSWQRLEIDLRRILKIDDYPELPDQETGVVISELTAKGEKTGLRAGDIVFAIDGKKITDHIEASNAVLFTTPGNKLQISFIRDGKVMKKSVKVSLWHDPKDARPVTKTARHWGLRVAEIDKESLFYQTTEQDGLLVISDNNLIKEHSRVGCYLVSVDDQQITSIKQFAKYLRNHPEVVLRSLCIAGSSRVFIYSTLRKT